MGTIYRKTDLGQAEIATRALKLSPRLRQALILVDGKRSQAELHRLISPPADDTLAALLAQGCIEAIAAPAVPAPPAPAAAPALPTVLSLGETRQRAVRWLTNALGPYADPLSIRIEKVKTPEDMRAALTLAAGFVRQQLGAAQASEFEQQVGLSNDG